jgi:hypothetical protein
MKLTSGRVTFVIANAGRTGKQCKVLTSGGFTKVAGYKLSINAMQAA